MTFDWISFFDWIITGRNLPEFFCQNSANHKPRKTIIGKKFGLRNKIFWIITFIFRILFLQKAPIGMLRCPLTIFFMGEYKLCIFLKTKSWIINHIFILHTWDKFIFIVLLCFILFNFSKVNTRVIFSLKKEYFLSNNGSPGFL